MGCCARFRPIVQFFQDLYPTYLQPIVQHPILQFFLIFIFPMVEFFLPITITSVILLLILRPNNVVPGVDAAVVTGFSLHNATSTLDYDIAVELSFHNPKYLDAKYLDLSAVASYGGTRLGPTVDVLPVFLQRSNATNVVHALFKGSSVRLDPAAAKEYQEEAAADGEFNVLVTVASTFMYDIFIKKVVYYYDHECYIRFLAPQAGRATALTLGTLCNAIGR